jgi:hypothetical protein
LSDSAAGEFDLLFRHAFPRSADTPTSEECPMIDLHYWPTPNGKKVTILLEECGLAYKIVPCNIQRGDQFAAEFLKMNPNHRMPVMVAMRQRAVARRSRSSNRGRS